MEGQPRTHENRSGIREDAEKSLPGAGSRVLLTKQHIEAGKDSQIRPGEGMQGVLVSPIEVGSPVLLGNGARTSRVQRIDKGPNGIRIATETSVYELRELFSGLVLDSRIGRVSLPENAHAPLLEPGSAPAYKAHDGSKTIEVRIDRDALRNVLIQAGKGTVHIIGERYVVLARVGGAHVPFYRSSSGTGGKRQGEWYPFFGHTGDWIIKGDIAPDGSMNYSPEITEVQRKLNEHLVLPEPGYLNRDLNMTSGGRILYSVGKEIPMDNFNDSDEFRNRSGNLEEAKRRYVKKVTGYDPAGLAGYHPDSRDPSMNRMAWEWMSEVIQAVRNDRGHKTKAVA